MSITPREMEILATPLADIPELDERAIKALSSWIKNSGRHEPLFIEALTVPRYNLVNHTPDCGRGTVRLIDRVFAKYGFTTGSLEGVPQVTKLGGGLLTPVDRFRAVQNLLSQNEIVVALTAHRRKAEPPVEWAKTLFPDREAERLKPEFLKAVLNDPAVKKKIAQIITKSAKLDPK